MKMMKQNMFKPIAKHYVVNERTDQHVHSADPDQTAHGAV